MPGNAAHRRHRGDRSVKLAVLLRIEGKVDEILKPRWQAGQSLPTLLPMKKLLLAALILSCASIAQAQQQFSDYRPLNGDDVQTTQKKSLALETNAYNNITTNATTVVKSGKGVLRTITINTKGATANTATVYDNTAGSGTKIATIDTTSGPATFRYDVAFGTGLTIVTAAGTAADITVSYR